MSWVTIEDTITLSFSIITAEARSSDKKREKGSWRTCLKD